jgi:hypothetical protein
MFSTANKLSVLLLFDRYVQFYQREGLCIHPCLWQLLSKRCTRHGRDSATAISSGQAFKVKPVHHFLDKINRLLATPQYYQNVNKNPSLVELAS